MIRFPPKDQVDRAARRPELNPLREAILITRQAMRMPVERSRRRWSRTELNDRVGELVTRVLTTADIEAFTSTNRAGILDVVNQVDEHWIGEDAPGESTGVEVERNQL